MRLVKKWVVFILMLIFIILPVQAVYAHPELTNVLYTDGDTGWVIKEYSLGSHNADTNFIYCYDAASFTNTTDVNGVQASTYLYTAFTDGIRKWTSSLPSLSINEVSNCEYVVSAEYRIETSTIAYWQGLTSTDVGGNSNHKHHKSGKIVMNAAQMPSTRAENPITMAHEIGHMIGLHDVYVRNDILMYGYSGTSATGPTQNDINGAKVVTGLHVNADHAYTTIQYDSIYHKDVCNVCDGFRYENHNPIEIGYNLGSSMHQIDCSECGLDIVNQCTSPFVVSSLTKVASENLCRTLIYSCANGHSYTYNDITHLIDSNNKCLDCDFTGTSWCLPFTHNWSIASEQPISQVDKCYKTFEVCSKCKQSRENIISSHSYADSCTSINCSKCNWAREAPGHAIVIDTVLITTQNVCKEVYDKCSNCTFRMLINTDTTHSYGSWSSNTTLNKCERTCSTCGYVDTKAHSYDYGCDPSCNVCSANRTPSISHTYDDCLDTGCNKCSYTRTAPGHGSYTYGAWTSVSTAGVCQKRTMNCYNCSYSGISYNYSHSYYVGGTKCIKCGYIK